MAIWEQYQILIQWALADPQDWEPLTLDSIQSWRRLPSKPVPSSSSVVNNTKGWVNAVSIQGVVFEGEDHVAASVGTARAYALVVDGVEQQRVWLTSATYSAFYQARGFTLVSGVASETALVITGWADDPEDYLPEERYATVWTFLPVAPDPAFGGQMNTRQSVVFYLDPSRIPPQPWPSNAVYRPWSEFVPPQSNLQRHGIWLASDLYERHKAVRRPVSWEDWRP